MASVNWNKVYDHAPTDNSLSDRERERMGRFEKSMSRVFERYDRAELQGVGKFKDQSLQLVLHIDSPQGVEPGTYEFDKAQGAKDIAEDIGDRLSDVFGSSSGPSNVVMVEGDPREKYGQFVIEFPLRSVFGESQQNSFEEPTVTEDFQRTLKRLKQIAPSDPRDLPSASFKEKAAYGLASAMGSGKLSMKAEDLLVKGHDEGRLDKMLEQAGQYIKQNGGAYGQAKNWANQELIKQESDDQSIGNLIESYVSSGSSQNLSEADFSDIRDKGELFVKWEKFRDKLPAEKALQAVLEWMGDDGAREAFKYVARMNDMRNVDIDNRSKWGDLMDQFLRAGWDAKKLADELVMGMGTGEMRRMLEDRYQSYNIRESGRVDEGQWVSGMSSGDIKLQPGTIYYFGASKSPDKVLLDQVKGDRVTYYTFDVEGNATQRSEQKGIFRDLAAKGSQTWLDSGRAKYFPEIARSLESLLNGERGKQVDVQEYIRNQEKFKVVVRPTKEDSDYDRDDPWYSAENYGNVAGLGDDKLEITLVQRKSEHGPDLQDLRDSDKFEILDQEKH